MGQLWTKQPSSQRKSRHPGRQPSSQRMLGSSPAIDPAALPDSCFRRMTGHVGYERESKRMPSFDTVCEPDLVEVKNAVENAAKEIGTRFDFKGTSAAIEIKDKEITVFGDAEFQLGQVEDILTAKLAKRNVDVRFLDKGKPEKIGGDKVKRVIKVRSGIESEAAKKIQKLIKDSKLKLQAAIQDGKVRVSGAKRDDLQAAMALIRKEIADAPLSFTNFRD
jgi:uncharacterized protein YajQ (UPF0234 family)